MNFLELLIVILSTFVVYFLINQKKLSPVLASSLVTLIFVFILRFYSMNKYESLVFCSSFLGMTSTSRVGYVGLFFSCVFLLGIIKLSATYFTGIGGALGFTAFVSVLFPFLIEKLYKFIFLKY